MGTVPAGLSLRHLHFVRVSIAAGFLFLEHHISLLGNFKVLLTFIKGGEKHNHISLLNLKA